MKRKELFVVTGGTRGIGQAIAKAVDKERFTVVVVGRERGSSQNTLADSISVVGDLSMPEGVQSVADEILSLNVPVGVLVNNAGAFYDTVPLDKIDYPTLAKSMQLHCFSPLMLANLLKARMEEGQSRSIVNIGSIYGSVADPDGTAYSLSKCPIPLLTLMMAKSYAPKIRVNCVLPGHVDTDMTRAAPPEFIKPIIEKTPLKRLGSVDEISSLVMFLLADKASFITGATIRADGGFWTVAP